jgi:hypothetical protein
VRYFFLFLFFSIFFQNCSYAIDINALFEQGMEHFEGLKTLKRNPRLGNFFILKVIEYGKQKSNKKITAQAYKSLGDSFYSGDGIPQSQDLALYYYKESAKQNYPPAFFNIAAIYKEQRNYKQAKFWIKKYIKTPGADLKKQAQDFLKTLEIIN